MIALRIFVVVFAAVITTLFIDAIKQYRKGHADIIRALSKQQPQIIYCKDCKHCTKSEIAGFWHCEAWGQDVSMSYQDPEKYFCAE